MLFGKIYKPQHLLSAPPSPPPPIKCPCKNFKNLIRTQGTGSDNYSLYLNYNEKSLSLVSAITGCVSISMFDSLVGILICILNPAITLKTCTITA